MSIDFMHFRIRPKYVNYVKKLSFCTIIGIKWPDSTAIWKTDTRKITWVNEWAEIRCNLRYIWSSIPRWWDFQIPKYFWKRVRIIWRQRLCSRIRIRPRKHPNIFKNTKIIYRQNILNFTRSEDNWLPGTFKFPFVKLGQNIIW